MTGITPHKHAYGNFRGGGETYQMCIICGKHKEEVVGEAGAETVTILRPKEEKKK